MGGKLQKEWFRSCPLFKWETDFTLSAAKVGLFQSLIIESELFSLLQEGHNPCLYYPDEVLGILLYTQTVLWESIACCFLFKPTSSTIPFCQFFLLGVAAFLMCAFILSEMRTYSENAVRVHNPRRRLERTRYSCEGGISTCRH